MMNILFFLFKIFTRIENFFYEKARDFLLRGNVSQERGCKTNIFYHKIAVFRNNFFDWIYRKLRPKGIVLINVQGNKMYVNADETGIVPWLLMDGVMEKYETELFKKTIKENMLVIDVGANIGYFTLIAAKLVGKEGIVYAFEPVPHNYKLLCKNIEANDYTNVTPVLKALSNKCGKDKLWLDKIDFAIPSFSKENVLFCSENKVLEKNNFMEVETTTLDEFFKSIVKNNKIDVIKIDTQGAEGHVIDGAEEILRGNNNLKIFMEFWPEGLMRFGVDPLELLHRLQKYGFKINLINERKQTLESIEKIIEFCKRAQVNQGINLLLEKQSKKKR